MKGVVSKLLAEKPGTAGQLQRDTRWLRRLESLTDSVFALVIVLIVFDLPDPAEGGAFDLVSYILNGMESLFIAGLGISVVLVYWFQSNLLLGNLERTNQTHAGMTLLQVFLVLVYLLAVGLGISVGKETPVLLAQSGSAALMGFASAAAWWYASANRRLLSAEISDDEISALRLRVLAEPLTATITFALAFVSVTAWELGWLAYPLIASALRRKGVGDVANGNAGK